MKHLQRPRRRWAGPAAVVAAAALLAGGCVRPGDPEVGVTTLNADIVFGVKEPAEAQVAAPPNFAPPATTGGPGADFQGELLPPRALDDRPAQPRSAPLPAFEAPKAARSACPDAAVNAFPEESAPLNVPGDRFPAEGSYRWKRSGTVKQGDAASAVSGLEQRVVHKLTKEDADPANEERRRFTYEVVQPLLGTADVASIGYRVDTAAATRTIRNPAGAGEVRQGEAERGVVVESVRVEDAAGNRVGQAFNPSTGLLLLPLPVLAGEQFTSVAIDPVTQQTWRYEATVVGRDRVDACGQIIEGWRVQGTLAVSGSGGGTRKATFVVAPHLGGLVIGEFLDGAYEDRTVNLSFNVGQKVPDPVADPPS